MDRTTYNETADYESTFTTALTSAQPKAAPKKKGKPKLTAKEKKERMVRASLPQRSWMSLNDVRVRRWKSRRSSCVSRSSFAGTIPCVPYLTTSRDKLMDRVVQGLRRNMEMVIEFMIGSDGRGVKRMYTRALRLYHPFTYPQSSSLSPRPTSTKLE